MPAKRLALPDHEQKRTSTSQGQESSHDETVLKTHVGVPWSNAIRGSKAQSIADDYDRCYRLSTDILKAVNVV